MKLGTLDSYRSRNRETRRFFLITLIPAAFIVSLQRTAARSVVFENITRDQQQRGESSELVPCIAAFVDEYFDHPERISLWLPDESRDIPDLVQPLLSELYTRSAVYMSNVGMMDIIEMHNVSASTVILSKSATALDENDICFTNYCKRNCNFAIALTSPFIDETDFLTAVDALIQRICLRSIFKLTILAPVGDSVLLAGSLLERIDEIYVPAESVLLGRCEGRAAAVQWRRFANRTRMSFGTRVVSAAMFENFPYSFLANDTGQLRFDGVVGLMLEEIARRTKVELDRKTIARTNRTIEDELHLRLYNSTKNDLVFGGLMWNPNSKIEYTSSYGVVSVAWMVPIETNVSLRGLIAPFRSSVWYAIICVLIIGGIAKMFFIRDISFLDITALVLGVPINRQPTKASSRIQFISWVLFGFFITQFYLGSLAYQLIYASSLQIESLEELISSGLELGGSAEFVDLLGTNDTHDDDDIMRTIRENFIVFEEPTYISQMTDLVAGKNDSLALIVMLNLSDVHHVFDMGYGHIIKETMGSYPLALASWRGFPYLNDINLGIQMLIQAGLVNFWTDIIASKANYYEVESEQDDNTKIYLDDIAPAFLLLIIGYLSGCCLLIIEVLSTHKNCYGIAD